MVLRSRLKAANEELRTRQLEDERERFYALAIHRIQVRNRLRE